MDSVMEGLAEYYSADLTEKVQRGFRENVLKGKVLGGPHTFGYDVVDHKYVINPIEGPIVKEVFRLYVTEGFTMNAIVKRLKESGMRWKDGREIQHSVIERMVANPKYIGILKCATEVGKDKVPRLVDDNIFEKAQKKRERHKHRGGCLKPMFRTLFQEESSAESAEASFSGNRALPTLVSFTPITPVRARGGTRTATTNP